MDSSGLAGKSSHYVDPGAGQVVVAKVYAINSHKSAASVVFPSSEWLS